MSVADIQQIKDFKIRPDLTNDEIVAFKNWLKDHGYGRNAAGYVGKLIRVAMEEEKKREANHEHSD